MVRCGFEGLKPLMFVASMALAWGLVPTPANAQTHASRPTSAQDVDIPLSDARKIGPNSVRFSAAQFTRKAPTVVLFGATTASWHKARAAIQQAVFEGYPVSIVFMGSTGETPSLEIYAKGLIVTKPINLDEISQSEITRLMRDVWKEYYAG